MVQQTSIGLERQLGARQVVRVTGVYNHGTDFIIGRPIGTVFNPVVGGPDTRAQSRVERENQLQRPVRGVRAAIQRPLRRSHGLHALLGEELRERRSDSVRQRADRSERSGARVRARAKRSAPSSDAFGRGRVGARGAAVRVVDPGVRRADGHPDAQRADASAAPAAQCWWTGLQEGDRAQRLPSRPECIGGIDGQLLPLVSTDARFNDTFNSLDLRLSKIFQLGRRSARRPGRGLQPLRRVEHPGNVDPQLLGFLQRARAGLESSPALPAI